MRVAALLVALFPLIAAAADPWFPLAGGEGRGKGKKVVLVSGDEEYRSEEALTQLAKILATHHAFESTRGLIAPGAQDHPILRGIRDGDIWRPSDVYTVRLPLPGDATPLVLGQVLEGGKKNDPMMPVAWTKTYSIEGGPTGRVFTTTMAAAPTWLLRVPRPSS